MSTSPSNRRYSLAVAAVAAFCTYFCMYAFRKPFTAAVYENDALLGLGLKTVLVISQLAGYMLSKFIGIRVVSEMRSERRAMSIVMLILSAEVALVGFAVLPMQLKPVMLFLNGLPLGMVFGLVLSYLEGRRQTEALSAALCASFIISSGVVKSVGQWLLHEFAVGEFQMPALVGAMFLPALLVSVWLLQKTPPPDEGDRQVRKVRRAMNRDERLQFFAAYWPGLSLMMFVYIALTVIRTVRDDFGVEIWRDMGVSKAPSVFATTETVVAVCVTAVNALAIWIAHNLTAIRAIVGLMCAAFAAVGVSALMQAAGMATPFAFMVACGVGLYIPYVAFHTTVFERLIAVSRHPGNLGFLMYVADALGYLGYAVVLVTRGAYDSESAVLPFFRITMLIVSIAAIAALLVAVVYFQRVLSTRAETDSTEAAASPVPAATPAETGETA